ncbi:MAG: hypothetical protein IIC94_05570 [Chloroflexi bacterium]|nr:hypothetical protein [Chloroflexota bacterium]
MPGPWNDYLSNYDEVDTISGIPFRTGAEKHGLKGFQAQDGMANETPGPIVDRSKEHLGVHGVLRPWGPSLGGPGWRSPPRSES